MASSDLPTDVGGQGAGQPPTVPEAIIVDHRFDVDGLYALRAEVAAHAGALGADESQIHRLVIVASELASNAIRYGGGHGRLRMWRQDGSVWCQVTDEGPGLADPTVGNRRPELTAASGRGLWIARQLCDTFVIDTGGPGTTVTAAVSLADNGPPID